ncbi:MAG: hypothetical protein M1840_004460 [Geoglossum simile]|nr:MAG: hypothetical protein M1840_004460 [Geoglossum simile]
MAQVTYTGAATRTVDGGLFAGRKFWFSYKLPSRSHFIDLVKSNGGEIVPLEQAADIKIVDHCFKKGLPPDSYSYTYIEQSVRHGELQDLEDHRAGPNTAVSRPVASCNPAKGTRHPFSSEDDRLLYDWVTSYERSGGKILGNLIYQQLELTKPHHPWQSWRDRWVKHLSHRAAPPQIPTDHPSTLPAAQPAGQVMDRSLRDEAHKPEKPTKRDGEKVALGSTSDLAGVPTELYRSEQQIPLGPPLSATAPEDSKRPTFPVLSGEHAPKGLSPPPTDTRSTVTSTAGSKRKLIDTDEETAATERAAPRAAKKTRPQQKDDGGREILSTPELGPSSPPAVSPSQTPPLPEPSEGGGSESEDLLPLGQTIPQSLTDRYSNPQRHEQTTQALLGGPTQVIDFELAEPEGGWDNLLDNETLQRKGYPSPQPAQPQDTQALLQGPTQIVDFGLAEPAGGWNGILLHTLPQIEPKSASQQPSQNTINTEKQLGAWIDAHVTAGATEDDVLLALKCSSMHTGLAELVLNSLARDEGVPEDVKGIWTEREDEALKGGDGRAIKMLEEKHGKEAFQMRWTFLATYDQIDDEL